MEHIEQETASIIKYIQKTIGNSVQYLYHKIPEDFTKPTVYFPVPEFRTRLSSVGYYNVSYMWLIKIFAPETEEAYVYAREIVLAMAKDRFLIPLAEEDGTSGNKNFYVQEPEISKADNGVYTVEIDWDSARPYTQKEVLKMQRHFDNIYHK